MTNDENTTYDIREELNTIMAGDAPLQNLRAVQTGPVHYTVLSARNGSPTVHRVDLQDATCSCEDMTYNNNLQSDSDEGREICAHLAYAMLEHPQLDASESVVYEHLGMMDAADSLMRDLQSERDAVEEALVGLRDAEAGATATTDADTSDGAESGGKTDDSPPGGMTEEDVAKAAEDLQAAFDEVIDDMQVEYNDGLIWFQTGQNTPDDWPFPGGDETFKVVTSPDSVMYVHDGSADWADSPHKHYDSKPGEWFKNALDPQEVDDYISEVLS